MQPISGHYYMRQDEMGAQKLNERIFKCRSLIGGFIYFHPVKGIGLPKLIKGDLQGYSDVTAAMKRVRALNHYVEQSNSTTISSAMEGHMVFINENDRLCLVLAVIDGVAFVYDYDSQRPRTYKTSTLVTDVSAIGEMVKQMVDAGDGWQPPLFTGALKRWLGLDCGAVVTYMVNNVPEEYREDYEDCIQAVVANPEYNGQNPLEVLKGIIATKYNDNPPQDCWTSLANELEAAIPEYTAVDKAAMILLGVPNDPKSAWNTRFQGVPYPQNMKELNAVQDQVSPSKTTGVLCAIFGADYVADDTKDEVALKDAMDKYLNKCGMLGATVRDNAGYSPTFMSNLYIPIFHRMLDTKMTWEDIKEFTTRRGFATCTNQDILYAFCKAAYLLHLNTPADKVYNGLSNDITLPGGLSEWVTAHMEGRNAAFPDPEDTEVTAQAQTSYLDFGKNDIIRSLSAALEIPGNQATPERLNGALLKFYASIKRKVNGEFFLPSGEPAEQTRHDLLYILGDILVNLPADKKEMYKKTPPPPANIFAKLIAELNKRQEWPTEETLDAFIDGIKL